MSKAVSWGKAGSGFDAREAAREAARRQGKSLGEWLHSVIADNSNGIADGGRGGEPSGRERMEALTTRLERLGASTVREGDAMGRDTAPPRGGADGDEAARLQLVEPADDAAPRRSRPEPARDEAFDKAFATMQHLTRSSERRTDEAIASVARLIESGERRRERDRDGVDRLTEKLADIEMRLAARDEAPIQGALARLEARLEQIGRRGEAEASARALAAAQMAALPQDGGAPIRRLEDKLNAVLDALATPRPAPREPSPPSLPKAPMPRQDADEAAPASAHELPLRRRRPGAAIAEIAERPRLLEAARAPRAGRSPELAEGGPLSARVEEIRRGMTAPRSPAPEPRAATDAADGDALAALEDRVAQLAERRVAADTAATSAAIVELRAAMRAMGGRLEEVHELAAHRPGPDLTNLESLVRDLGLRIEAVQQPGAGAQAIDGLQTQIGSLATRLERTETGLAAVGSIERAMHDLFAHLEETRAYAETAAARAATEAARTAVAEKGFDRPAPRADVAVLKAMQEDADVRTRATLDVVHEALDKVVERLAVVERGLAEARVARATRDEAVPRAHVAAGDPPRPPIAPEITLGAAEPLVGRRADRGKLRHPAETGDGAGRADFIAAARRAAHAAQTDPSVVAIRRPIAAAAPEATRAGLALKSRDYVASHKRPVLLALAAVLVVAATMALVQRLPLGASGPEIAETAAPTRVAGPPYAPSRPDASAGARLAAMAPKALPRSTPAIAAQIPGSDPIATSSIPNLPAFAAQPAAAARPVLPAGLVQAADAGDGAAEYTLATAYAEGHGTARDFARAAVLYAKAAEKGIVPAQYRLGALYEKGLGVAQDKLRARSLYRQAADAGNPRAMHNLAVLLADGDGKPDYDGAAIWFRKAAQYGVHDSQFNLAILLARGLGVDQSLVQSYQWFAIAAAQGDTDAAGKRDEVGSRLSASELSVAKALAAAFRPRSADPDATEVAAPPGGWDGDSAPVHLNGKTKIS